MNYYPNSKEAIQKTFLDFKNLSYEIQTEKWQGYDLKKLPGSRMREVYSTYLQFPTVRTRLEIYRKEIGPNLPWADDHFEERVGGIPLNPGETWKSWPWSNKADHSRRFEGKFSHTYMERYWPRTLEGERLKGLRFEYGDLNDLVSLLEREPNTRQAYLPIFFPEDTGAIHGDRIPCSLGYLFTHRSGYLHIHYAIRSCDLYRHFRDDVYMTIRLLFWVLEKLKERNPYWKKVKPGIFSMWIGSLHLFINDYNFIFKEKEDEWKIG